MTTDLDIAEVARRSGVPASTLRFDEQRGLIISTGRHAGWRLFARLTAFRDGLRHAAAGPAPSHIEYATFVRIVEAAEGGGVPRVESRFG
ncbi:MerR family DNA-binding transcriptional regulator [Patulibacter defluvii]|uniref:MerR family DNA-binding transcriptional regulator n=1 Tax=Patulibacter defluvii TaxID=3095358 RepID=UPI002A75CF66|nr:MerR family DNA-binding transcriptional regulator [Patulibacter sp. DM4]